MQPPAGRTRPAWVGPLTLILLLSLLAILLAPRVAEIAPEPGSQGVPSTASLRVTFSRPMDALSVEARLSFEPSIPGDLRWEEEALIFQPQGHWPRGSQVNVHLAAGARSTMFLPILSAHHWSFTVGSARVLYLWSAGEPADLYARSPEGGEPERLSESAHGVMGYGLSADGGTVVYSNLRADGGCDLRMLDLSSGEDRPIYAGRPGVQIRSPALSPQGRVIAFELARPDPGKADKPGRGSTRVWLLSLDAQGGPYPVGARDHVAYSPTWSPSGWLAYYNETLKAIALMEDPRPSGSAAGNHIPTDVGLMGSWSPRGEALLYADIVFPPAGAESASADFYSHIYRVEVATGRTTDLSSEAQGRVEDASPVYAPNGEWIGFTRKFLDQDRWTLGRQLWLMRPDGSEARPLTDDPEYNVSALAWSPDSKAIAYTRKNQADINQAVEVWWVEVEESEPAPLAVGGYMPGWIP